jgi:hypothetical protein
MGNNIFLRGADTPATGPSTGFPAQYASKIENLMCNQQGDNVVVTPVATTDYVNSPPAYAGDLLVAVAIGLKSYQPFDLLHGNTTEFGFFQGLNDFNANPTITDTSAGPSATITGVTIAATAYAVTSAMASNGTTTVYNGTFATGLAGYYFTVAGFSSEASPPVAGDDNNGTYLCTASSATQLTLANPNGVHLSVVGATATDYVLTVTASNSFAAGEVVTLSGTAETYLNGTAVTVVSATGALFTANYPAWTVNVTNASDTGSASTGGNIWTLVTNLNIVDSDYTVVATPPTAPNPWPSSAWNLDGYYPSIYVWVAQNVRAGTYSVNLNSMYQDGIDPPQDLAAGKPIFDGGVNFQVFCFAGAALSGAVETSSLKNIGTSTTDPATAPATLTTTAANGDLLLSVGLQKSGNVFSAGTVGEAGIGSPPVAGAAMTSISNGKLVGSAAHYMVEYALTGPNTAGTYDPNFSNPLGYEMVVASIAIASS